MLQNSVDKDEDQKGKEEGSRRRPEKVIMTLAKRENFFFLDYWYGNWGITRPQWK